MTIQSKLDAQAEALEEFRISVATQTVGGDSNFIYAKLNERITELRSAARAALPGDEGAKVEARPEKPIIEVFIDEHGIRVDVNRLAYLPMGYHKLYAAPQPPAAQPGDERAVKLLKRAKVVMESYFKTRQLLDWNAVDALLVDIDALLKESGK